jgi:hypothetical protein
MSACTYIISMFPQPSNLPRGIGCQQYLSSPNLYRTFINTKYTLCLPNIHNLLHRQPVFNILEPKPKLSHV